MSAIISTPILSKKRQNTSISGRKKPLKTIKNVLSSLQANYWPVINIEEKNKLLKVIEELNFTFKSLSKTDKKSEDSIENLFITKSQLRNVIKFGINEIYKCLKNECCAIVLLDADLPYVLIAHILRLTTINSIPLLCIKDFNGIIKNNYGFKSSSMCLTVTTSKTFPRIIQTSVEIWNNYSLDKNVDDSGVISDTLQTTTIAEKEQDTSIQLEDSLAKDFIKFSTKDVFITTNNKQKRKKLTFQPLLIKRIQNNPKRMRK